MSLTVPQPLGQEYSVNGPAASAPGAPSSAAAMAAVIATAETTRRAKRVPIVVALSARAVPEARARIGPVAAVEVRDRLGGRETGLREQHPQQPSELGARASSEVV